MKKVPADQPCPVCKEFECFVSYTIDSYTYIKCPQCKHLFQGYLLKNPAQHTDNNAGNHHISSTKKRWDYSTEKQELVYKDLLDTISKYAPSQGNLLDIGCGNGAFMLYAAKRGWNVTGIEPRTASAEAARATGAPVYDTPLEETSINEHSFDAVVLWQVIEHLTDPANCMKEINRILKPNGVVALSTPNTSSIAHLILRQRWPALEPNSHYHLFSPLSLIRLMHQYGFTQKKLSCMDIQIESARALLHTAFRFGTSKNKNVTAESMSAISIRKIKMIFTIRKIVNPLLNLSGFGENIYGYFTKNRQDT